MFTQATPGHQHAPAVDARDAQPPRDLPFAQAERLAHWAHLTLGVEGVPLLDVLTEWRGKYAAALSNSALAVIVAHVAVGRGLLHVGNDARAAV